jgi:hypothetical protein
MEGFSSAGSRVAPKECHAVQSSCVVFQRNDLMGHPWGAAKDTVKELGMVVVTPPTT